MISETRNRESDQNRANVGSCSVCRDLLANLGRFFDMLETLRGHNGSDWLTVDDIARELKISKSIVYRLIRSGELEAVDLVVTEDGEIPQKGHYRIRRSALDRYLEAKRVKPPPNQRDCLSARLFPDIKNHLGL